MESKTCRWRLRPGSRKDICPSCGKKTFVRYVLTADGTTEAGSEFGRCDRESKCGYNRYPSKELSERYDASPVVPERKPVPLRIDPAQVQPTVKSVLFGWVSEFLGRVWQDAAMGRAMAVEAFYKYQVGATQDGRTVFWQVDEQGEVHAGKVMAYKADGHRDHAAGSTDWVHRFPGVTHTGVDLDQCPFGLHLLNPQRPDTPIAVVESEKTALVMSEVAPTATWVAVGGAAMIGKAAAYLTKYNNVTLIPDEGQLVRWMTASRLHGWKINTIACRRPVAPGCDILDLLDTHIQPTIK